MAGELPTVESLLGPPPPADLPSVEDLLGPPPSGVSSGFRGFGYTQERVRQMQARIQPDAVDRVINAFGQGAKDVYGMGPLGIDPETLKKYPGVYDTFKGFTDYVLQPLAAVGDLIFRAPPAIISGTAEAGGQVIREVGGTPLGYGLSPDTEAQSFANDIRALGDVLGFIGMASPTAAFSMRRGPATPELIARAEDAGVLKPEPVVKPLPAEMPAAAEGTIQGELFTAPASATKDMAGNINLSKINSADDVKDVLRSTAESRVIAFGESSPFIDARRGVQTNEMTIELARQVGMTPEKLLERRKGQAFNAEEAVAARNLLVQSATEVKELAGKAIGGDDASLLAFEQAVTRHAAIQEQVAGMTAEAGRALQSFQILAGTEGGQAAAIKAVLEKAGGRERIEAIAQSISTLDPENVGAFIQQARKATTVDMVREAWVNGLLSAFRTHEANLLGNSVATLTRLPETIGTAAVGLLHKGEKASFREVSSEVFGLVHGARDGLRAIWHSVALLPPNIKNYKAAPGFVGSAGKVEHTPAIPGRVGEIVRIPSRILMTEDDFFQAVNYRAELNKQAVRTARNEGLTGDAFVKRVGQLRAAPTDKMVEKARASQLYYSFQTELGPIGKKLMSLRDSVPGGWLVAPFIRTPINITKFAVERSPFGVLMKSVRDDLMGRNGAIARDRAVARMAIGTSVGYATYSLAAEGYISGNGPQDPAERAVLRLSGWQPYSIKLGDKWYSYNRLDPVGLMIGASADLYEARNAISKEDNEKIGAMIVASASQALLNKTWLSGPANLIAAVQDPDRYGDRWLQRMAGSVVPGAVAQFATESDPVLRDVRSMLDAIQARIPGATAKVVMGQTVVTPPGQPLSVPVDVLAEGGLFPKRDIFGEEIRREGTVGGLATPISESTIRRDPVVNELMTLGIFPAPLDRSIRGVELTPAQYDEFQMVAGRLMKIALDQLVTAQGWSDAPDFARQQIITGVITQSRESGRAYMLMKYPQILEDAIKAKTAPMLAQ